MHLRFARALARLAFPILDGDLNGILQRCPETAEEQVSAKPHSRRRPGMLMSPFDEKSVPRFLRKCALTLQKPPDRRWYGRRESIHPPVARLSNHYPQTCIWLVTRLGSLFRFVHLSALRHVRTNSCIPDFRSNKTIFVGNNEVLFSAHSAEAIIKVIRQVARSEKWELIARGKISV